MYQLHLPLVVGPGGLIDADCELAIVTVDVVITRVNRIRVSAAKEALVPPLWLKTPTPELPTCSLPPMIRPLPLRV